MNINYETDKDETFCQTYGGQEWLESDYEVDDYGIQIGDLSISGIPSKLMVRLACEMVNHLIICLLYTSPSPRDRTRSRMPSSA